MDLSAFDFRTGKMLLSKAHKSRQRVRYDSSNQVKVSHRRACGGRGSPAEAGRRAAQSRLLVLLLKSCGSLGDVWKAQRRRKMRHHPSLCPWGGPDTVFGCFWGARHTVPLSTLLSTAEGPQGCPVALCPRWTRVQQCP